jgi:hypothetical protein
VNLLDTSERNKDRRLNLLVLGSFLTAAALIVFAIVAIPKIVSSASTTAALDRNTAVAGCRAGYRTQLVDTPQARLLIAKAHVDARTNDGLEAIARGDDAHLTELLTETPTLADLRTELDAAAVAVQNGVDRYVRLVALSQTDQAAFLDGCHHDHLGG